MHLKDTEVAVIGGGSTGLALAYHCSAGGRSPKITVLEERSSYQNDRTWCFWDFGELAPELDALVRRRWHCWRFSANGEEILHQSVAHPYCAISAGDYYRKVNERISKGSDVELVTGCRVDRVIPQEGGYLLQTTKGTLRCGRVVDTRPPYLDYLLGEPDYLPESVPAGLAGTPIFQVFFGLEIASPAPLFNPAVVWLMTRMKSDGDGLEFVYLLPYSRTSALIELTRFSRRFLVPEQLRTSSMQVVSELFGEKSFSIVRQEGAVLPMGLPVPLPSRLNWVHAGISGGALRPATGYAFVRTQRWAVRGAEALRSGQPLPLMSEDSPFTRFLDNLFLEVLAHEPRLSTDIFFNLGKKLPPDCFARFMMEKGNWLDNIRMITAMPTVPFIRRLAARTIGR